MNSEKKKQYVTLIKLICATVMLSFVILAISLGWFTNSTETDTNGISGNTTSGDYQLITIGSTGIYDNNYITLSTSSELNTQVLQKGKTIKFYPYNENDSESNADLIEGYVSTGNNAIWNITSTTGFNNNDNENTSKEISPGTWGYVDFYILPTRTGELTVTCELDLTAYCKVDVDDINGTVIKDGDTYYQQYVYGEEDTNDISKLIKGHIMFFTIDEDNQFKWLTPNDEGKLIFNVSINVDDSYIKDGQYYAKKQRIYWVWPSVLGQVILSQNRLNILNGYYETLSTILKNLDGTSTLTIEDNIVKTYMQNVDNEYFYLTSDNIDDIKENAFAEDDNEFSADAYATLDEMWNNADHTIGKQIGFITVELNTYTTIEQASAGD